MVTIPGNAIARKKTILLKLIFKFPMVFLLLLHKNRFSYHLAGPGFQNEEIDAAFVPGVPFRGIHSGLLKCISQMPYHSARRRNDRKIHHAGGINSIADFYGFVSGIACAGK